MSINRGIRSTRNEGSVPVTSTIDIKMNAEPSLKFGVWIVTLPFFSHVRCASQLAELIAKHGLSVTLFATKDDLQRLQTSLSPMLESWKRQDLDIQLRPVEIQSAQLADSVGGNVRFLKPFELAEFAFEEILKEVLNRGSKPTCVIVDFLLPGAREVAAGLSIPAWYFIPMLSSFVTTNIYLKRLASKGILTLPHSYLDNEVQKELISLPGLPLTRICELNACYFKDNPLYKHAYQRANSVQKADVLIMAGFVELEPRAFHALEKLLMTSAIEDSRKSPHIWTVGPMSQFLSHIQIPKANGTGEEVNPCIEFLDAQPPSSVVYVAFGTDVSVSQEQLLELVYGLENSQQPFLCALPPPKKASDSGVQDQELVSAIPPDCLARIKNRSYFMKWAPQMKVLSHPSTGAFISHFGFSSVLESICKGVPIIGWPRQYDQFTNCRHLVDEAQIALEVCPGLVPGGFVDRKDVEKSINTLFHSDEGTAVRERALQMKHLAEESVGENGSSARNLQALVTHIKGLAKMNLENLSI